VCPETAAPLPPRGCGGPLYLLSCIKPLDAFTSGTERLQSKLVQTFLKLRDILARLDAAHAAADMDLPASGCIRLRER